MYNNIQKKQFPSEINKSERTFSTSVPRQIILKRGLTGFGFNIVGGDNGDGIFVSFILAGGPADLSGQLRCGDQLLYVNGVDVQYATHAETVGVLKTAGESVELIAAYKPDHYRHIESKQQLLQEQMMQLGIGTLKTTHKRTLFVRALFDYDSSKEKGLPGRGLSFKHGTVLDVTNASDEEWWQARKLIGGHVDSNLGIIPSKTRLERHHEAKARKVIFLDKDSDSQIEHLPYQTKKRKYLLNSLLSFKKKDRIRSEAVNNIHREAPGEVTSPLFYEVVVKKELKYCRPVLLLGPLKAQMGDDLLSEFPDQFACCVPHTTRLKKENEVDGRDYHFVTSKDKMEHDMQTNMFIEYGQYNGNLYGTSLQAVKDVASRGKHCLLDVSGHAIKQLQSEELHPIVVFIKALSMESILDWSKGITIEEARNMFEQSKKQEDEFLHYFTAVISGDTAGDIYNEIKAVIGLQSQTSIWLPSCHGQL